MRSAWQRPATDKKAGESRRGFAPTPTAPQATHPPKGGWRRSAGCDRRGTSRGPERRKSSRSGRVTAAAAAETFPCEPRRPRWAQGGCRKRTGIWAPFNTSASSGVPTGLVFPHGSFFVHGRGGHHMALSTPRGIPNVGLSDGCRCPRPAAGTPRRPAVQSRMRGIPMLGAASHASSLTTATDTTTGDGRRRVRQRCRLRSRGRKARRRRRRQGQAWSKANSRQGYAHQRRISVAAFTTAASKSPWTRRVTNP